MVIASLAGGGSERVCVSLANRWAEEGRRVEILLVQRKGRFLDDLDARVGVVSAERARTRDALLWMRRQLNRRPEVPALLFGFDLGVGLGALRRLGLVKAPLVYREGSCPRRNIRAGSRWKYRAFVAGVDGVVAQSRYALGALQEFGVRRPRSAVIWNPLPVGQGEGLPKPAGGPAGGLRLVTVGRLSPEKGLLGLVEALPLVRREWPGTTLTIAGEGPQRADLQARVEALRLGGVVRLPGHVPDPARLCAESDLFVLPSDYEGQPNALFEALQAGCPVLAAGGPGVGEVLSELGLGDCRLEAGDLAAQLPAAIRRVLALPPAHWERARTQLARGADAGTVARAYREFCAACRG